MKFVTWLRMCAAIAFVCLLAPVAHAQQACATSGGSGYTLITATHIGGQLSPTPSATLYVQPMSGLTSGIGAARVGTAGGLALSVPYMATVTAGAVNCGVPDALLTNPGICYAITIIDSSQTAIIGAGLAPDGVHVQSGGPYGCAQPNGTTWSLDSYVPSMPVSVLPTSLFDSPGTTTGAPGTLAAASVSTVGPGQYHLSFTIPTGAAGPNCNVASPPGHCDLGATQLDAASVSNATKFQAADPPGGAATALQDATQNYVDTSQAINATKFGCSVVAPDNLPCLTLMLANPSGKRYYVPPGTYNVSACSPIQAMASHFEISGAAWAATTFNFTGTALSTAPTNTTGWWTSGASTIQSTVAPHVGDPVLAYQTIAGLVMVTGIQPGTTVTAVSGTGPFTVTLSLPTTAAAGSSGSPVPVEFGWQCILAIGADDTNFFTIQNLGFTYSNLPQAPSNNVADYPATAILLNTSGLLINGVHDFVMRNLYFGSGSRGIASTKNTVGTNMALVWGANFENIIGAAGTVGVSGLQGATIDLATPSAKGGGVPRISLKNIFNRQTINEPLVSVQRADGLSLHNLESNNGQDTLYDFDNDGDAHLDLSHNEFYTVRTTGTNAFSLHSSSISVSNVDIAAHICPTGTTCNTSGSPTWSALEYNGSAPGALVVDNVSLTPYTDSLGYCLTTGSWTAGQTALTLNAPSPSSNCPAGLAGLASGQYLNGQGIQPNTVIIVSAGPTYALSLPATSTASSLPITASTYASYLVHAGTGAVAPGSRIGGSFGFNAALVPGETSNALFALAGNMFHGSVCYVTKEAGSTTSPASFFCPAVTSTASGSTNGIPTGDICSISLFYTGSGTFPASQYRELATCHDNGAGGLSGFNVYSSDNAVRGAESFVKIFSCDKAGNCASTASMKTTVIQSVGTQTISGCSLASAVGGASAGKFASGTTGTCTVTITPGLTATNGYYCSAFDQTTTADLIKQTASNSTTCTISGTTTTGDVIVWHAVAF